MLSAFFPRLPARPACCVNDETLPGNPRCNVTSKTPTSTPNSSAFVAHTPRSAPENRPCSVFLRSCDVYPPRYALTVSNKCAPPEFKSKSRAYRNTNSHSFLVLQNAMTRKSCRTHSTKRRAISTIGEDRCLVVIGFCAVRGKGVLTNCAAIAVVVAGSTARSVRCLANSFAAVAALPFGSLLLRFFFVFVPSPPCHCFSGGFHITKVFAAFGEPSCVTTCHLWFFDSERVTP
jgi:hypothetical protein|mmetsp:Transcript_11794/g.43824  ORF Transcript_11794/g.43824 Transcript_11794/m.43824 type:complete len:233 (+) Transcript_11794:1687-2385(+)